MNKDRKKQLRNKSLDIFLQVIRFPFKVMSIIAFFTGLGLIISGLLSAFLAALAIGGVFLIVIIIVGFFFLICLRFGYSKETLKELFKCIEGETK